MRNDQARDIAERLVELMRPYCTRIEIAGSLRRGNPVVKDVEIVAIPVWEELKPLLAQSSFFGMDEVVEQAGRVNLLHRWAERETNQGGRLHGQINWIKAGQNPEPLNRAPFPEKLYWRAIIPAGTSLNTFHDVKLDLFLAGEDNWGSIFVYRTGSRDFNIAWLRWMKAHTSLRADEGYLWLDEERIITPTEESVFQLLGLEYVEPRERVGAEALKPWTPKVTA
jgi:DNA polymerase/3'-5' exonuclease PolX